MGSYLAQTPPQATPTTHSAMKTEIGVSVPILTRRVQFKVPIRGTQLVDGIKEHAVVVDEEPES